MTSLPPGHLLISANGPHRREVMWIRVSSRIAVEKCACAGYSSSILVSMQPVWPALALVARQTHYKCKQSVYIYRDCAQAGCVRLTPLPTNVAGRRFCIMFLSSLFRALSATQTGQARLA